MVTLGKQDDVVEITLMYTIVDTNESVEKTFVVDERVSDYIVSLHEQVEEVRSAPVVFSLN